MAGSKGSPTRTLRARSATALDQLLVQRPLDQQARAGGAALAVHAEDLSQRGIDGQLAVGILEHHHRRFAAELERPSFQRRRAGRDHQAPSRRLTCEADQVDAGMGRERGAGGLAKAVHDVEHSRRQFRLFQHPREQRRTQRRPLGRLDHDRVAGRQGRGQPPGRQHQRRVPGHDQAGDADRLVHRVVDELLADLERPSVQLRDHAGVVVEVVGCTRRESAHLRNRHPDIEHFEFDELGGVFTDQIRNPAKRRGSLRCLLTGPGALVERPAGGSDGRVDIRRRAVGNIRQRFVGDRVESLKRPPVSTGGEGAVDVVSLRTQGALRRRYLTRGGHLRHRQDHIWFPIGNHPIGDGNVFGGRSNGARADRNDRRDHRNTNGSPTGSSDVSTQTLVSCVHSRTASRPISVP